LEYQHRKPYETIWRGFAGKMILKNLLQMYSLSFSIQQMLSECFCFLNSLKLPGFELNIMVCEPALFFFVP